MSFMNVGFGAVHSAMRAIIGARGLRGLLLGALLLVLGACSSLRLAYNNAPELGYFWLDRYVDFDKAQGKRVSAELEQLLRWHRSEELPLIAELLQNAQTLALQTPSGPQLCALNQTVLQRSEAIGLHAVPAAAAIVTTLTSQQLANLAKAYEKSNRKMREEWRSAQAHGMDNRTLKSLERLEDMYGSLSSAQRRLFQDAMAATGFDSARYLEEVHARQQITLQTLDKLRNADSATAQAALVAWIKMFSQSANPAYREYYAQVTAQTCQAFAQLHAQTTLAQRRHMADYLKDYEQQVRMLAAQKP
jgi:hypothetical protein